MTLSVRFYKRLILLVLLLAILVPTGLAIHYGAKSSKLAKQLEAAGLEPSGTPGQVGSSTLLGEAIDYQLLYPELYGTASLSDERILAASTVYLTFDCAPSVNTQRILDILDEYGIKATFFLMGTDDPQGLEVMKQVAARGHSVGLYSYSGSYLEVYDSVSAYLADFEKIYNLVYETTGVRAEIFRFPGGSVNTYNGNIYRELIAEMLRRNFVFFDWNHSGIASGSTAEEIKNNIFTTVQDKDRAILSLSDTAGSEAVADALPDIISGLRDRGYSFQPLIANVMPVVFSYKSAP